MSISTLLPPLRAGEHIKREEFLRRWEAMPQLKHAELIRGIVYMPSPVSSAHSKWHSLLAFWLGHYVTLTPGCETGIEPTWLMGEEDVPQPDLILEILPEHGGQSRRQGPYSAGAPELVVEVCYSSAAKDLGPKLKLYERSGVREYIIALIEEQRVVWRELRDGRYKELPGGDDGWLHSRVFPGLWLDASALWNSDRRRLLEVLQRGLDSPEHAAFVRTLQSPR